MQFFRATANRYPLTVAASLIAVVFGLFVWSLLAYGAIDVTGGTGQPEVTFILEMLNTEIIAAATVLGIVALLGWGKQTYLTTRTDWAGLKWAGPLVGVILFFIGTVVSLLMLEGTVPDRGTTALKLALFCIAVGIFEEVLYRGILFHGLAIHLTPFWTMIASSAVFGLFHMQNMAVGQAFDATAFQSLNAFALGVLFCAIMLQTNSIWWAVALHTVWNLFLLLSAYITQSEPALMQLTAEDLANQQTTISLSLFALPLTLLALGLFIYARWAKRTRTATAQRTQK